MKQIILLVVLAAMVGIGAAVKYLPWWGSVLMFLGLIIVAKFAIKHLLKKLLVMPFKMKGAVLRNATAQIHSITVVDASAAKSASDTDGESESNSDDSGARNFYQLDVMIVPQEAAGKFTLWEPGDLSLMRPESGVGVDDETDDGACSIHNLHVEEDGQFKPYEGMKYPGPQRLRMVLAVQPGVAALKFRYYFEAFGEVRLPAPVAPVAKAA